MKHKIGFNRLGRRAGHRKAMTRNMLTSLFRHGRIRTTKAKALAVRRTAEKMITRAKVDSVHNRRMIGREIKDQETLAKMFTEIGPRFKERPGGYTRVLKLGPRPSDAAEMVILEILSEDEGKPEKSSKKKAGTKKSATAGTDSKKTASKKASSKKEDGSEKAEEKSSPKKSAVRSEDSEPSEETAAAEASAEDDQAEEAASDKDEK